MRNSSKPIENGLMECTTSAPGLTELDPLGQEVHSEDGSLRLKMLLGRGTGLRGISGGFAEERIQAETVFVVCSFMHSERTLSTLPLSWLLVSYPYTHPQSLGRLRGYTGFLCFGRAGGVRRGSQLYVVCRKSRLKLNLPGKSLFLSRDASREKRAPG